MTDSPDATRLRVAFLGIVFLSLISALVLRLYYLQVLTHEEYAEAAANNQVRVVPIEPGRGRILDRNGEVLIGNRSSYVVGVRRDELSDEEAVLPRLAQVLGMTVEQVRDRMEDRNVLPYTPIPIKEDVPEETVVYIQERIEEFPGVTAEERPARIYPKGRLAAHVLGYVGEITSEQLEQDRYAGKGYRPGSIVGRGGLEYAYESQLRGTEGQIKLLVDSQGKVKGTLGSKDPVLGKDLVTTIDARIQALAEESLRLGIEKARSIYDKESAKRYVAPAGGVVVLDPSNGEVIASASFPDFDPAAFVGGISPTEFKVMQDDPTYPLLNRVMQSQFPPGSTFKVVTAAAALQEGVASRAGRYACPPSFKFADTTFNNWRTLDSGMISLPQALVESCDTVFYGFAAEFYKRFKAGQGEKLQDYARGFGFGEKTGIELPGERKGRVPDDGWLKEMNRSNPKLFPYSIWLPGYTINMSIGQGDVLTTPLQQANAYAAIANGGTLIQPHLGLKVVDPSGAADPVKVKELRKLPVSPANLETIRRGLEGVATEGTARGAFAGFPIPISAKTGTAEQKTVPPKQPFAWFVAYAPAKDPKYVVAVMLEEGGHGGETAAPVARRVLEGLFNLPLSDITPAARTD